MDKYIISIEIASTRVTLLLAMPDEELNYGVKIVHSETTITGGVMGRGKIVEAGKLGRVVENLLYTKHIPKRKDNTFFVCFSVSGNDYWSYSESSAPVVVGGPVTPALLEKLRSTLHTTLTPDVLAKDETITSVYPRHYIIDGRPMVTAPVGSRCERIEALWLVTAVKKALIEKYSEMVNTAVDIPRSPLERIKVYPITSSKGLILLSPEDREEGVALVDFGAETTGVAVYYKGVLQGECTMPLGGRSITWDIMCGLNNRTRGIKEAEAEQLKRVFGIEPNDEKDRNSYKIKFTDGQTTESFLVGDLKFYARARAEEIVDYINNWINTNNTLRDRVKKFVITGGGAKLKGLDKMMASRLHRPVEVIESDELTCPLGMATRFIRDNKDLFVKTAPTAPTTTVDETLETEERPAERKKGLFDKFGAVIDSLMDEKEGRF